MFYIRIERSCVLVYYATFKYILASLLRKLRPFIVVTNVQSYHPGHFHKLPFIDGAEAPSIKSIDFGSFQDDITNALENLNELSAKSVHVHLRNVLDKHAPGHGET